MAVRLGLLFEGGVAGGLSDAELLERFERRDGPGGEAAFRALVDRHAASVLRACRGVLGDRDDAADAAQAAFLVLARRAGSIRHRESVGPWLFGVALRCSRRLKSEHARHRRIEGRVARRSIDRDPSADPAAAPSFPEVFEELDRLPNPLRDAVFLCDVEELPQIEAADRLGVPIKTLQKRLYRARSILRARLTRRGLAPASITMAALRRYAPRLEPSMSWIETTTRGSIALDRTGRVAAASAGISTTALTLTQGASRMIGLTWLGPLAARLVAIGLAATGAVAVDGGSQGDAEGPEHSAPADVPSADFATLLRAPLPEPEELARLLRRAAEAAMAVEGPPSVHNDLRMLADLQAKVGDLEGARTTFGAALRSADRPNLREYAEIARAQANAGLEGDAEETIREALGAIHVQFDKTITGRQTAEALASIIATEVRIGDTEGARATLDRLERLGNFPEVVRARATLGDLDEAIELANPFGYDPGYALAAILDATLDLDAEAARALVDRIEPVIEGLDDADLAYFPKWRLSEAQARLGRFKDARRTARSIGEGPSRSRADRSGDRASALVRIAEIQRQGGDPAGARSTLELATRLLIDHPEMTDRDHRVATVANALIQAGDVAGARQIVETMPIGNPALEAVSLSLARDAARTHDPDAARAAFLKAVAAARFSVRDPEGLPIVIGPGERFDLEPTWTADVALARFRSMAGDLDGAVEAARAIGDDLPRRTAYREIAFARSNAGDVAGALGVALEAADETGDRRSALVGLAWGVMARLDEEPVGPRR